MIKTTLQASVLAAIALTFYINLQPERKTQTAVVPQKAVQYDWPTCPWTPEPSVSTDVLDHLLLRGEN
tara:strand:+ start:216 stop:419 length:204 start_codon:yes stop_codon:yes gene_type:complete